MLHSLRRLGASVRAVAAFALVLAFIAGAVAPALAIGGTNGTISGTVTDAQTRAPLANVSVSAVSATQSSRTVTDSSGGYRFLNLPLDTYTLTFSLSGYDLGTVAGVTVQGDQIVTADATLSKTLRTIGRTSARSQSAAFQPKQTTDSYQVSGRQVTTALGKTFATSQSQLQTSVPGLTTTVYGSSSIRGSTRTEIAYQFDGINYTDPFSSQFNNSLALNGLNSLQVNPGAGDASQGNAGAGAVNIVVKRGSRPAFGSLDLEAVSYPFTHVLGAEYGFATPDNKFSNYSSFIARNEARIYGPVGTPAYVAGALFGGAQTVFARDFINNFVYKFGHDQSRSLQFLTQTRFNDFFYLANDYSNYNYKTADPAGQAGYLSLLCGYPSCSGAGTPTATTAQRYGVFQSLIGLLPRQTSVTQALNYQPHQYQPVDVVKVELDQTVSPTLYWANRYYAVHAGTRFERPYSSASFASSSIIGNQGGDRVGFSGDLVKSFGDKHVTSLTYLYESDNPTFDGTYNAVAYRAAGGTNGAGGGYELPDFIAPGLPCPTTDPGGNVLTAAGNATTKTPGTGTGNPCGYLAQFFGGNTPRLPDLRAYGSGRQQLYGLGVRDQFSVSSKLRLDYGLRIDGTNYHFINKYPGIGSDTLQPTVTQPRFAASYQFDPNDAVRFSYGRSVQFIPLTVLNAPVAYYSDFQNIPSRDSRTGKPATYCGPPTFTATCLNYAQQLHDEYVQLFGLENFAAKPATYGNYDFSLQHQFKGNVGLKITPFFKRGYNVNVLATPVIGLDPNTNLPILGAPTLTNLGIDKSTGVEFYLSRDVEYGLSGFLNLTYVNRIQNVPPGYNSTEDFYPSIPPPSLALGQLYRAGYLSPLSGKLALTYKSRSGFRVNPIISYDRGYPIGAGLLVPQIVNGVATVIPNTNGSLVGYGAIANSGSPNGVSQYLSPTNPGTVYNPNVAATRGTAETSLAGGILSKPRTSTDIVFEYSRPGTRNTIGMYIANLFNVTYSEPGLNARWQPVATGIGGPQTGQLATTQTLGPIYGFYNFGRERFGQNAYNLAPSGAPLSVRFYYQLSI